MNLVLHHTREKLYISRSASQTSGQIEYAEVQRSAREVEARR